MRFFSSTTIFLLLILISFPISVNAQKILDASFVTVPPVIDGIITPGEWNVIDSASAFIQMEPQRGSPATESTVAYLEYDSSNIYVAIISYHDNPGEIVARIQQRDNLTKNDDLAGVLLDTYNDKRTAYVFLINPLNTQIDMKVSDDGLTWDLNWDTQWLSGASVNEKGWIAEMSIPFRSISYKIGLETWGVNFGRVIRKNAETVYWSEDLSNDFRVSQSGILTGIHTPYQQARLSLFPYGTLRYEDSDITGIYKKLKPDAGLDAELGITSQLKANLTLNPDFATVEGDQEQINLTRWELSFPEKRLFFLDGNNMFSTRIRTFYSRRIGDIDYGGKVTGKIRGLSTNMLLAHSVGDTAIDEPPSWFSAIRLKQDILKSSFIGLTFADKSWNGGFTRSLSADYLLNLGKTWQLTGQYVASSPGDVLTHSAWYVRVARENSVYHYHIRYSNTGENFRDNVNKTGFIRDDDMKELDSDITYRWWMENKQIKYITIGTLNNIFWSHQNVLRSWFITEQFRIYLHNRISFDLSYNNEFKLYEKKYYNYQWGAVIGYNTDEWASASITQYLGRNYDRDFYLTSLAAKVKPLPRLALEYNLDILRYKPDTTYSSTVINVLSASYNFTNDLWIRVFAQNNSSISRIYFYGLFGWRFKPPFGALYLIYTTDGWQPVPMQPDEPKLHSRVFFLKLTYPILSRPLLKQSYKGY